MNLAEIHGDESALDELVADYAQELELGTLNSITDEADQEAHIAVRERFASFVNGCGYEGQIKFLIECEVDDNKIEEALK